MRALKLFIAIYLVQTVVALQACPNKETLHVGSGNIRYHICAGTDYTGGSTFVTPNVASVTTCAELCDRSMDCLKAVYDTQTRDCHFKALTGLGWVTNKRYETIYVAQTNVASCPYSEIVYESNGKTFRICRDTDLRGASAQQIRGITSNTVCAQRCSMISTCVQAVWDSAGSVCHIKADAKSNTLIWSTDRRYDVIRQYVPPAPANTGSWSDLIRLPVIPVAAYIVPESPKPSRMLFFSSWGADAFGGASGRTQFADYNFESGAVSARTVSNTNHDMFCPGMSSLQDGRILITGGSDAAATSFYDPKSNMFTRGPDMKIARGYQTSVTLSDNRVFTIGGAYSGLRRGKDGEVYDPSANTWTKLPGAKAAPMLTTDHEGIWREDNHGWLFAWKNSSVFQAGPSKAMNWYGTSNTGSQSAAGTRDLVDDAMCGIFVMYEPGKILTAGGSPDYTDSPANARAHVITIGDVGSMAKVERVSDMAFPRGFANAVVLPDGTVLVTGGQRRSIVFSDTDGILFAELFNPATKTWKTLSAEAIPRNYHSVSILLPDARVFSGGGGLCYVASVGGSTANCNKLVDHADGQIFTPPYLFDADGTAATRPIISAISTSTVRIGSKLTVTTNAAGAKLVLIRIGSVTHSVNSDQRRVPLENVSISGSQHTATLPNDSGILIPGYYYLFVVNKSGVPSLARTLQITL